MKSIIFSGNSHVHRTFFSLFCVIFIWKCCKIENCIKKFIVLEASGIEKSSKYRRTMIFFYGNSFFVWFFFRANTICTLYPDTFMVRAKNELICVFKFFVRLNELLWREIFENGAWFLDEFCVRREIQFDFKACLLKIFFQKRRFKVVLQFSNFKNVSQHLEVLFHIQNHFQSGNLSQQKFSKNQTAFLELRKSIHNCEKTAPYKWALKIYIFRKYFQL